MKTLSIEQLLDRQAIVDLVHLYCRAADRHDHVLLRSLYHDDAIEDHGSFFKGLASDFIDQMPAIQESMAILHHNITTTNIRFDPDKPLLADGEIYVLAFHQIKTADGLMDLLIGGRYIDTYEKREDDWKFTKRAILADWANVHQPSIVDMKNPMVAGSHIGKAGKTDPSYQLLTLFPWQA